jgi:hypothetical protein
MALTQEQLKFRNTFNKYLTDANVVDAKKHREIMEMLADANATGLATPDLMQKYTAFRENRLKALKSKPVLDQNNQPVFTTDGVGNQRRATGQDLFFGGQYRPDLGVQGVKQSKTQQLSQLRETVGADVKRLEGARQILADESLGGNARLLGAGLKGIGTGVATGLRATTGIGAPSAEELGRTLLRTNIGDLSAENALQDASKPAVTGGFRFAQGLAGTLGGTIGSEAGGALLGATSLGATKLAPWLIPLVAAGSSFLGGAAANKISEGAMRGAYGDQYDDVLRVLQQADEESGGASLAGELGNVLLQGSPVLASGIGGRQVLGTVGKGVFGGKSVRLTGSAEQMGLGSASTALTDMSTLPQMAASPNKFDTLISNFLTKYGATATSAADKQAAYKIFEPLQPRALPGASGLQQFGERVSTFGKRFGQFSEFARDTPGVSQWMADAIGEQAVNFGQAAVDYKRQYDEAAVTGAKPPSAMDALVNLGFGALFIGNNRFTDVVGGGSRAIGAGALDLASNVPGVQGVVEGLRTRQRENNFGVLKAFTDSSNRRVITGGRRSDHEIETGVRTRIGAVRPTSAGASRLAPDEVAYSLGDGTALIYNQSAGTTRTVPHADVYGGVDDTGTVETGTTMANALTGIPTVKAQTGLKGFLNKEADVVLQVGDNKQQVVGPVDTGHVIVRETRMSDGEAGVTPFYSIMRVSDLEGENQQIAATLLGDSGIPISTESTTTTAPDGSIVQKDLFSIAAEQQFLTKDLAEYDSKTAASINKEFPTLVQFDDGVQLQGRVLGIEANGDIKFQPMSMNMMMMRVPGVNVLSGPSGKSTVTTALQPVSIKDLVDEQSLSAGMRPRQTQRFNVLIEDADGLSERGLQTMSTDGESHAVMLTPEQLARVAELRNNIKDAVANARVTTSSPQAIDRVRSAAVTEARNTLLGDGGIPSATNDYTLGSLIQVKTPDGMKRGIVLDNTTFGPSVILDDSDGKPVVIQESEIMAGESTPRPERVSTTGTTRGPEPARNPDEEGSVFSIATAYRNKALKLEFLTERVDAMRDASPSELATELFGFDMDAGRVVGTRPEVTSRYTTLAKSFQLARDEATDPAVKAYYQGLMDTLYDMNVKVRELDFISGRDLANERRRATREAEAAARAAGVAPAIVIPTITGTADNVYDNYKQQPTPQTKAEFLVAEIEDIFEKNSTDGEINEGDRVGIASDLFGMQTSEKDGVTRVVGAVNHFTNRYSAMLRAITAYGDRATTSAEFKARATDALAKLDKMKTAVVTNVPFISQREYKAETEAAADTGTTTGTTATPVSLPTTISVSLIKDVKSINLRYKARFIQGIINSLTGDDGFTLSPIEAAQKIFGLTIDNGRVVGDELKIFNAAQSLKDIVTAYEKSRAASTEFKDDAPRIINMLESINVAVTALPRVTEQEVNAERGARGDVAAAERAIGQEEAIRNSEQARAERRVTVQQAQAIQGLIRTVRDADGVVVPVIRETRSATGAVTTRNIAQSVILKVASRDAATLKLEDFTREEQRVIEALGMPAFTDKEWWRNAFQGTTYINDRNGVLRSAVQQLVDLAVDHNRNRRGQPLMLSSIPDGLLDANQLRALNQAAFINADGSIDLSGIVIHGSTERGMRFGVLNQVASDEETLLPPSVGSEIMDIALEAVSTISWETGAVSTFTVDKPKNKADFEAIVKRLISKSKDKNKAGEKAKAIADLFDTLSHGAVKRRVQLMMEAAEKGYFTTRSAGAERTLSPTRGQRLEQIKFDSYLEGELRPLYDALRRKLNLPGNTDVKTYLTTRGADYQVKQQKIAAAIVEIMDEQLENFYTERFPAFANFETIPDIAQTNGMFVQIYDPDKQVAANVVMAFQAADVSTMVHEIAHAFFEALPMDMQADLSSGLGHSLRIPTLTHASVLTYEAQEKFAYGLEMALANFKVPTDWRGTNAGRPTEGASRQLTAVINGVAEAVRSSYDILTQHNMMKVDEAGKYTGKEWQIAYTSKPVDGVLQNPNGRVYLWKGAPVILHDGTYAKVTQQFGTTRNGRREVNIAYADGRTERIKVGEIKAIGGPAVGLNPVAMSVLSIWIGERRSTDLKVRLGLEDSTPAMRAKYIQRDPTNGRIFVSRRNIGQATGDITDEDIQLLLNGIGLPRIKAIQLQAIRERVGTEELKRLVEKQKDIAREFMKNKPNIIDFEDNALRALTREYASAVLYSRMYDQAQKGNTAAASGIRGYESPRNYRGRDAFNRAHQAVMEVIFANREAMQSAERQIIAITNDRQNQNWRIKESNGKPMYDPRTGELVIEKIQGAVGRKTVVGVYKVNLKTGVVIIPQGVEPFVAPMQKWIETDAQFPDSVPGGKLTDINARAKEALERVGVSGINSVRATSPEFFIARALVEKNKSMFLGNIPVQPPTVLSQVSDVTSMMQTTPEQGVRNEQLAQDVDTITRDLYTKEVATNVGTSPTITEKPLYQMDVEEYDDAVFQLETKSYPRRQLNVPARFIRFGMPDKDADGNWVPSSNWLKIDAKGKPAKEKGISVYRAWKDPITGKFVLESPKGNNLGTQGELVGRIDDGLKIYEFVGETKGNVGTDLEHTILPKTAKLIGEIAPDDVVTEQDPSWTLEGNDLSESETPNWDRVKPLPSQAVAIYAAQKAGLPVNQKALKWWETSRQWDILTESEGRAYIDMSLATDSDLYDVEGRVRAMSRLDDGNVSRYAQGMTYSLYKPVVATNNPDSVFQVDITDPVNLGNTNLGVTMAFNSASDLFKAGNAKEYVARLRQLDNVTKDITDNTFDDVKATGGFDLTASIAAGDTKPHYTGSVEVKEDSFRGVLARAAYMARKMGQPNVHITSDAGKQEYGVSVDGASVVPSLTFPINNKVSDAITLRAFAESMPSVLNGAIYNSKEGTLTVYAVPEKFMMRAEAKDWTQNAKDAAREFFFTTDDGAVKEPKYAEGRLKLWNLGSSEFGAQGRFIPYDTVLDIVSTVSPNDSVLDQTAKVTESTQRRLRGDVQDALTFVFGKDVKLPADAKFRREFIPAPVQQQMANHYGIMPVDGFKTDSNVIPAYKALQNELDRQFKALKLGIDFAPETMSLVDGQMVSDGYRDMYQGDTAKGARDVANGHLYIYPTTPNTFGNNKEVLDAHPLFEDSPYKTTDGRTLKWNDVLRAVHDAISHGVYAVNLSPSGQDMAYVTHAMVTQDPMAVWALANETRMQNMWKSGNDSVLGPDGQPYISDLPPVKLEYKFSLPVYESIYTGVASVDDKLRAFGTQLGDYAGTLSLTAGKGEQTFYGVGNNRSAFADGAVVQILDPSMKGKAIFDLKNGTVRTSEAMPVYLVDDVTSMASTAPSAPTPAPTTPTPTSAMGAALLRATTRPTTPTTPVAPTTPAPTTPAAPAVVVSARPTRQEPGALRFLYMVNQLLKLGASGDASPVLMQNFPLANILENPDMFIRQLGLQAQVIFNPNTGFHLKDGRIINADGMRGRKLFHETLTKEVRNRNTYEMAKNSGLSLAAADADKLLEEARQKDPNATWDNVDDLGYNTDISTDGEFMKHLPGQGQSERFYAMSKDLVKMRQFDDMVHHLVALGYNPTAWVDDEGNYIDSPFNRALKDVSHLLNVIAGDIKVHDIDETDESIMRLGKFLLYSPRWLSSRLLLDDFGRFMFKGVAKSFGAKGEAYAKKVLELNGMTPERLKARDGRVGAMHARLLNKSWLLWLGLLGLIYGVKATNPRTMEVTVDKFGARLKIGDYSFRAPGAIMTHIELSTSVGQAILEWQAQKGATTDKPLYSIVGEKMNSVLLSRSSPVLGLAGSIVTGRDTQGAPAFVSDEAVDVFWKEVIGPQLNSMGVKGLTDMKINKAIAERMLWWWARDAMEMYADQRKFGVKSSEALLKAAGIAAVSAQGGRAMYVPKELDFERKKAERMEAPIKTGTDLFTGVEEQPIVTNFYEATKGADYTNEVAQPFFGATGTDFEDMDILPRDTGF